MTNLDLLIVEDSPEDYEATARAFKKANLRNPLIHCECGDDALDYLYGRGEWETPGRPCLILLDLNLPGTSGREVLAVVKADEFLKRIPVIILTTSCDEKDIEACYDLGANSYVQKPVGLTEFMESIGRLKDYWLEISVQPKMTIR